MRKGRKMNKSSKAMEHERKLLIKYKMLEEEAHKIFDDLEVIFQRMFETKQEIEEQREKQIILNTRVLEEPW